MTRAASSLTYLISPITTLPLIKTSLVCSATPPAYSSRALPGLNPRVRKRSMSSVRHAQSMATLSQTPGSKSARISISTSTLVASSGPQSIPLAFPMLGEKTSLCQLLMWISVKRKIRDFEDAAALVPTLVNLESVLLYAPSGEIRQLTVNLLYYSKL